MTLKWTGIEWYKGNYCTTALSCAKVLYTCLNISLFLVKVVSYTQCKTYLCYWFNIGQERARPYLYHLYFLHFLWEKGYARVYYDFWEYRQKQKTKTTSKNIINPNNLNQSTYYPHCIQLEILARQCVFNIYFVWNHSITSDFEPSEKCALMKVWHSKCRLYYQTLFTMEI